jgi:hypothetical protein
MGHPTVLQKGKYCLAVVLKLSNDLATTETWHLKGHTLKVKEQKYMLQTGFKLSASWT